MPDTNLRIGGLPHVDTNTELGFRMVYVNQFLMYTYCILMYAAYTVIACCTANISIVDCLKDGHDECCRIPGWPSLPAASVGAWTTQPITGRPPY